MILPPAVFLSDRAGHQMLFRRYALFRQNTDFQPGNVVFRMAFTALIDDIRRDHAVIHAQLPAARFREKTINGVLNREIRSVMIAAEILARRNIGESLLRHQLGETVFLHGGVFVKQSAEPFALTAVKADGRIKVKKLMCEEIDLIANVQKGAARKRPDGKLSSLAGGLLPVDEFHFLLDDLNGGVQLVALAAKFFRLF